jgi:shikimate dehydrogenase
MTSDLSLPFAEVIGDPIVQSKSPIIHGFWLEKLGIAARYEACHVKPDELAGYFESRRDDPHWRGCNITIPHKIAALDFVTDPGEIRDSIGAINTVFRGKDGSLVGTNTDAGGFFLPIAEMDWSGQTAIVLGNGGAARAVLFALAQADIGEVIILARNGLKAAGLLAHFGLKGRALPFDARLPSAQLLKSAAAQGLDVVDGLDMLIGQAALAFELFYGKAPPSGCDNELRARLLK